jgi:uncharacterized protein (TIGR03067 family)
LAIYSFQQQLSRQVKWRAPAAPDALELQGNWTVVEAEKDGSPLGEFKNAKVTIEGEKFTTKAGDKVLRAGTLKADPSKDPKTIDVTYTEGELRAWASTRLKEIPGQSSPAWKARTGRPNSPTRAVRAPYESCSSGPNKVSN